MKTVSARLDIEIWVDCPECDTLINILDERDTSGHNHNEEGHILSQATPDGSWYDKHKEFEVDDVKCSVCEHEFNVKELEW